MKCLHCGAEHPENYRFCPQTGKAIPLPKIACTNPSCSKYGKQIIDAESVFCPFCGYIIKNDTTCKDRQVENGKSQQFPIISDHRYLQIYHGPRNLFIVEGLNEKWGVLNESFNEIIPCIYDELSVTDYDDNFIVFSKDRDENDELYGILSFNGKVIIPPIYNTASVINGQNAFVVQNSSGKYGVLNEKGKSLIKFEYDWISPDFNKVLIARKGRKEGCLDLNGNIVIPFNYGKIGVFNDQGLISVQKDGYWGIINVQNEEIIPMQYDSIQFSGYGEAILVQNGSTWSVLDYYGNVLSELPEEHDNALLISPELVEVFDKSDMVEARFYRADLHNYLPKVYAAYTRVGYFRDGIYIRVGEGYYDDYEEGFVRSCPDYLMDINGEIVYEDEDGCCVADTPDPSDGLFTVYRDEEMDDEEDRKSLYAVVDLFGNCILPLEFSDISLGYCEKTIIASCEGKPAVFDRDGKLIFSNGIDHELLDSTRL